MYGGQHFGQSSELWRTLNADQKSAIKLASQKKVWIPSGFIASPREQLLQNTNSYRPKLHMNKDLSSMTIMELFLSFFPLNYWKDVVIKETNKAHPGMNLTLEECFTFLAFF